MSQNGNYKIDPTLTVDYLMQVHPELTRDEAKDLLAFSESKTISHIDCYRDGSIIYPLWKEANSINETQIDQLKSDIVDLQISISSKLNELSKKYGGVSFDVEVTRFELGEGCAYNTKIDSKI